MTEIKEVIVWSKDHCPFCVQAKNLLTMKEIPFEERNISQGPYTREQLLEACPEARTVPQIVIDGVVIGGYDKLTEYFKNDSK